MYVRSHTQFNLTFFSSCSYRKLARDVNGTVRRLADVVGKFPEFKLLVGGDGRPHANVVGWAMSDSLKKSWGAGAIYAVAHEMSKRGFVLSALNGFRVHYCVTGRCVRHREWGWSAGPNVFGFVTECITLCLWQSCTCLY